MLAERTRDDGSSCRPRAARADRSGAARRGRGRLRPWSPRPRSTSSPRAASGSGRCWWCWRRSSAPRAVPTDVVKAAVVVELTHVASLYHDDVMDEARMRRGSPSANAVGQHGGHPGRRLPVRPGLRHRLRARPGVRPAAGPDLRPAGAGPDRRDGRAGRARTRWSTTCRSWPTRPAR